MLDDDFALDAMDATESRDVSELLTERHRARSMIVTSNRGPVEKTLSVTLNLLTLEAQRDL